MVTLTREAVGQVARALITLNGSTTTLDVKLALRKIGFYATQDEVRYYMLDITSKDGDVQYEDGGSGFRVYSFATPVLPVQDATTPVPNIVTIRDGATVASGALAAFNTATWTVGSNAKAVAPVAPVHRDDRPATYTVSDENGFYVRVYTNVTRAQAKRSWQLETGMPYTAARTVKQ